MSVSLSRQRRIRSEHCALSPERCMYHDPLPSRPIMKTLACAAALLLAACTVGAQNPASEPTGPKRPMTFDDLQKMRRLGDITSRRRQMGSLHRHRRRPREEHQNAASMDRSRRRRAGTTPHRLARRREPRPLLPRRQTDRLPHRSRPGHPDLARGFDSAAGTMGDPHQLTHITTEADNVTWDPDGKHLLFTSAVYPECSAAGNPGLTKTPATRNATMPRRNRRSRPRSSPLSSTAIGTTSPATNAATSSWRR